MKTVWVALLPHVPIAFKIDCIFVTQLTFAYFRSLVHVDFVEFSSDRFDIKTCDRRAVSRLAFKELRRFTVFDCVVDEYELHNLH